MAPWHHPQYYPVWLPDDPIGEALKELSKDMKGFKVVYLETNRRAAVFECEAGYTPRAWRRVRKAVCLGYLLRPAAERRDVMRYACLLAEEGDMPWEVAGPRRLMPELRRERAAVMRERAVHLRGRTDDGWGTDVPGVVLP